MKYFTTAEFARSSTADRLAIDNRIPKAVLPNIVNLVDKVLDPLRESYGKPIVITSGYRSPALNEAVRGAKNSHHVRGMAADIVGTPNTREENRRLFYLAQSLGLPFTQLIDEKNFSWVHISLDPDDVRQQVLAL